MNFSFHPDSEKELNHSINYYEECKENLGLEFATEIYNTIQRIITFPNSWQVIDKDIRRCLTSRFPFGVVYYQKDNHIVILAIMQLNRKPNYWKKRK